MEKMILVKNNLIDLPKVSGKASRQILGTVSANLLYYGYILNNDAYQQLMRTDDETIKTWWAELEPILKKVTGDDKKMDKFVVYKNFPREVLEMSQSEYWIKQILMYIGLPNELFTEEETPRDALFEYVKLKVLQLRQSDSLSNIYNGLLRLPAKWTADQKEDVMYLSDSLVADLNNIPFKENMVLLAAKYLEKGRTVNLKAATDVLRLAIQLSGGDVSMATNTKFKPFSRKVRRALLGMLEHSSALEEDMARDKNRWKKFVRNLHPFDYKDSFPKTCEICNKLYNDDVRSWNSNVETLLKKSDDRVLTTLKSRPGDYLRRLYHTLETFGKGSVFEFIDVLPQLKVVQLLKLQKYLQTINDRKWRTFPPKGNWSKLQIVENTNKIRETHKIELLSHIDFALQNKLKQLYVNLQDDADLIKLQTSDSELAPYGRGTVFPIPNNIQFIRTASYWECKTHYNSWFDNGWNFFNERWDNIDNCAWNYNKARNGSAVFSGDPTNSKDKKGRACQMIDLYPEKLVEQGVRYGVWNILCYSRITFNDATEVYAALQWGEDAQSGKLFEPSRCQLNFPLRGKAYTKYIAYIDFVERRLVYMDADLKGNTNSATTNGTTLSKVMPAYVEYLNTLPSVYDLFANANQSKNGIPITYSDENIEVNGGEAYVFKPQNENNKFQQLNLSKYLGL